MARPPKPDHEKLTHTVAWRVTDAVKIELRRQYDASGLTQSEFLRELLEHRKTTIVARPRACADKTRLLYLANKASNNLNQLAHRVNADHLAGKVSDSTYQVVLANLIQLGADLREAVRHVD